MILESQPPMKTGSIKTGLLMIFCLLCGLGVVLYHKFSGESPAWAKWQHLTLKQEVVLGQSPGVPLDETAASASSVPPLWSREPVESKDKVSLAGRAHTTKNKASAIEMQLLGHEEPAPAVIHAADKTSAPGFLPSGGKQRQLAQAESPRSLFEAPVELPVHASADSVPPAQSESSTADPFAVGESAVSRPAHREHIQQMEGKPAPGGPQSEILTLDSFPEPVKQNSGGLPPLQGRESMHSLPPAGLPAIEPMHEIPQRPVQNESRSLPPIESMPLEIDPLRQPQLTRPANPPVQNLRPMEDSHPIPASAPPKRTFQEERIPAQFAAPARTGNSSAQFSAPAQQNGEATPTDDVYQVQSGDNYWTISRRFYSSARFFSALAEYNKGRIPDASRMKPGMYVLVPPVEVLHQRYAHLTGGGPRDPNLSLPPGFFIDQNGRASYRVGEGDTLGEIAQHHLGRASRWVQIYGMNKDLIPDGKTLKIGSVLVLPADASQVMVVSPDHELR